MQPKPLPSQAAQHDSLALDDGDGCIIAGVARGVLLAAGRPHARDALVLMRRVPHHDLPVVAAAGNELWVDWVVLEAEDLKGRLQHVLGVDGVLKLGGSWVGSRKTQSVREEQGSILGSWMRTAAQQAHGRGQHKHSMRRTLKFQMRMCALDGRPARATRSACDRASVHATATTPLRWGNH